MEQRLVRPFEIKGIIHRLAHAGVAEDRPAGVHREALHAGRQLMGDFPLHHQPLALGREIIGGRPFLGAVLLAEIIGAGLEGLDGDGGVAVVVEADAVVIMAALVDPQILAPVVRHPLVGDGAAGLEAGHLVGAAAGDRLQRRALEFPRVFRVGEIMHRQHRHLPDDQRQFHVYRVAEAEFHLVRSQRLGLLHIGVIGAVERGALGFQRVEGPDHIRRRDRLAVMEAGLGAQREGNPFAVGGHFDALGQQSGFGEGLVIAASQQRIEGEAEAGGGNAAQDEGVQAVEGADGGQDDLAALRGVRVRIVEMPEIRRIFGFAMQDDRVACRHLLRGGRQRQGGQRQRQNGQQQEKEAGERRSHGLVGLLSEGRAGLVSG